MLKGLQRRIERRKEQFNLRNHTLTTGIDFASNDFLGIARSEQLLFKVLEEWKRYPGPLNGLGSTGSRLLTGHLRYVEELEDRIAKFHEHPSALIYNCGYLANLGILQTLASKEDVIFFDTGVHASTKDGIYLSRATSFPFRHQDLSHLEQRLKSERKTGQRFICIESLYSTDGTFTNLKDLSFLSKRYEAHLIIDEAHAVGVFEPLGKGLTFDSPLDKENTTVIVTFGKALGTQGAAVLSSSLIKQAQINFSRAHIYTTALPFHALAAIQCSYNLFPTLEKERLNIQQLIDCYKTHLPESSSSQIQTVTTRGCLAAKNASRRIRELGFDVRALTSPTVRKGEERLRITLHAHNSKEELLQLIGALCAFL